MNVPVKAHPALLQVICCCLTLSGSSQRRHSQLLFNSQSRKNLRCFITFLSALQSRGVTKTKANYVWQTPLVLFSLHGELARTADIITSKTSLSPSQADEHCCCCSLVYPKRVGSATSQYLGFCRSACVYLSMHPVSAHVAASESVYRCLRTVVNQTNDSTAEKESPSVCFLICLISRLLGTRAAARFKSSSQLITNPIWEIWQQFHLGKLNYTSTCENSHYGWIVSRYH